MGQSSVIISLQMKTLFYHRIPYSLSNISKDRNFDRILSKLHSKDNPFPFPCAAHSSLSHLSQAYGSPQTSLWVKLN